MQLFELAVALVFLLSLIAVSRLKRYLTAEDKRSYDHIVTGVAILAFAALAQVYSSLGFFARVPFLSEQPFFKLIFWIGMITGLAFLIDGVTNWVPLSRSYRKYNRERIEKLEFIKKIEQLVRVESRPPVIFETTLQYMIADYGFAAGAVYLLSRKSGLARCVGERNLSGHVSGDITPVLLGENFLHRYDADLRGEADTVLKMLPGNFTRPDQVIPVMVAGRLAGFFILWLKPSGGLMDEDKMNLRIAADVIGHELWRGLLEMNQALRNRIARWSQTLASRIDLSEDPKNNIMAVVQSLKERIPLDYFSLTVRGGANRGQRYTIGEAGGLLTETNIDISRTPLLKGDVSVGGRSLYLPDAGQNNELALDDVVHVAGYCSMVILPVKRGSITDAVVTIAGRKPSQLTRSHVLYMEAAVPVIADIVAEDKNRHTLESIRQRGFRVNGFLSGIAGELSVDEAFTRAGSLIWSELKPTAVRITILDSENAFLNSHAFQSARPAGRVAPEKGTVILSLMPYHELVLDTGRLMMINQEKTNRKMTEAEEMQAFGFHVSSALLVPIKTGSTTIGVISIGETRSWDRFQFCQADIQFVSAIAAGLALAVRRSQRRTVSTSIPKRLAKSSDTAETDRGRIRSSLSGIIGSVELLKATEQPSADSLNRCLSIIDNSARRISEYISSDET